MKKLRTYIALTLFSLKNSILSAMEYRVSFYMQVFGMVIQNVFFLVLWGIFFAKFPEIQGWTQADNMHLLAFSAFVYGMVFVFCGSWNFSKIISMGELDQHLTLPKSVLWQLLSRKTDISGIGDVLFGLAVFIIWGDTSLLGVIKFFGLSMLSAACVINFIIIIQSLAFYFGHIEDATAKLFHLLIGFSLYPQNQFYGALKIIMMTFLPAFYITTLPVTLMNTFQWSLLGIIVLFWIISFIIAKIIFNRGLKHYESGNLIGVKI